MVTGRPRPRCQVGARTFGAMTGRSGAPIPVGGPLSWLWPRARAPFRYAVLGREHLHARLVKTVRSAECARRNVGSKGPAWRRRLIRRTRDAAVGAQLVGDQDPSQTSIRSTACRIRGRARRHRRPHVVRPAIVTSPKPPLALCRSCCPRRLARVEGSPSSAPGSGIRLPGGNAWEPKLRTELMQSKR